MIRICTIKFNNIYIYGLYFYGCSLLAMGWFDTYFSSLAAIEIPVIFLVLLVISHLRWSSAPITFNEMKNTI